MARFIESLKDDSFRFILNVWQANVICVLNHEYSVCTSDSNYSDVIKEFQILNKIPLVCCSTNVSAANLIELCGSEELRRFMAPLMDNTTYWKSTNLRLARVAGILEAIGLA